MAAKKWEAVVQIAEALVNLAPEKSDGWVSRSFALHELKRTQEAFVRGLCPKTTLNQSPGAALRSNASPYLPTRLSPCTARRRGPPTDCSAQTILNILVKRTKRQNDPCFLGSNAC